LPRERTWTYVVSGGSDSFAVDSNGDVWGWGNNDEGQVGTGSSSDVLHPVEVLRGADMVSATADDSVAQVGF
jgi:alpha-tubulin suppressor-like RCC1 family protein